jgi:hypothetical protein
MVAEFRIIATMPSNRIGAKMDLENVFFCAITYFRAAFNNKLLCNPRN